MGRIGFRRLLHLNGVLAQSYHFSRKKLQATARLGWLLALTFLPALLTAAEETAYCESKSLAVMNGRVHIHDLHATALHPLGFELEHLTYRNAGRDDRLTDVCGDVLRKIIA